MGERTNQVRSKHNIRKEFVCFVYSSFKLLSNKLQRLCDAYETSKIWQGTKCTSGIPVSIVFHTTVQFLYITADRPVVIAQGGCTGQRSTKDARNFTFLHIYNGLR